MDKNKFKNKFSISSKIIELVMNYINSDEKLKKIFNHHNQKFKNEEMLKYIIIILRNGISFRDVQQFTTINWNTIYKYFIKLQKYNIIEIILKLSVTKYLKELQKPSKFLLSDTCLISNKLGIDSISYNPQFKKHKSMKISIITNNFNVPLIDNTYESKINDALILNNQLDEFHKLFPFIENKIFLGDSAYDSLKLKEKISTLIKSQLLTPKNKRNIKDENKIKQIELALIDKQILKSRIYIEHTINEFKKFKRLSTRYDKYIKNYNQFLYLAALYILINKTK
jgi:transposase